MANIGNSIGLGQFMQGLKDLSQGAKNGDALATLSATGQILSGLVTTLTPIGDFTAISNANAAFITIVKVIDDYNDPTKRVDPMDLLAVASNIAAIGIAIGKNHPALRAANIILGGVQILLGSAFVGDAIAATVSSSFNDARNLVIRRDPLVLDLDGDGLELAAASGATLFDHNADGIKTGTGWARPDDGFLVRDLNGNGIIDTGRELFGVDTIKSNGALATQGFDALKDLDSNGDGFITSADAAFGELKVWQDTNQDGISQSGELKTLTELNITSIGVNGSTTGPQAGQVINNNSVALSTTFTQDGQTHTVGAIDLEVNNFFTEFPPELVDEAGNPIPITTQAQSLPQMNGAGMVSRRGASNDFIFILRA